MGLAWRVVDTGANCGAYNMGVDQVLAADAAESPVLRFYGWNPPAISCGWNQQPECEANIEACRALGIDVVRRPTGGRAVLHWEELTYSVACRAEALVAGGGIEATHHRSARVWPRGCGFLGPLSSWQERVVALAVLRSGPWLWQHGALGTQVPAAQAGRQRAAALRPPPAATRVNFAGRAHERLPQLLRMTSTCGKDGPARCAPTARICRLV